MNVRTTVGSIGLVILILSAIVHVATYFQIDLAAKHPAVWALFPAAMALHIFGTIYLVSVTGNRPPLKVAYHATLARMPKWTWVVLPAFLIYLLASVALFGPGIVVPSLSDGKYIIFDHGRIYEYTYEQTQLLILYRLRVWSEFW